MKSKKKKNLEIEDNKPPPYFKSMDFKLLGN